MKRKLIISISIAVLVLGGIVGNFLLQEQKKVKTTEDLFTEHQFKASNERTKFGVNIAVDYEGKVDMARLKDEDYIIPGLPSELLEQINTKATLGVTKNIWYEVKSNQYIVDETIRAEGESINISGITYSAYNGLDMLVTEGTFITDEAIAAKSNDAVIPKTLADIYNLKVGQTISLSRIYYLSTGINVKEQSSERGADPFEVLIAGIYDDKDIPAELTPNGFEIPRIYDITLTAGFVEALNADYLTIGEGKAYVSEEEKEMVENDPYEIAYRNNTYAVEAYFAKKEEADAFIIEIESKLPELYSAKPMY